MDGSWAVHRAPSDRYYRCGKGPGWLDLDVVLPLFGHGRKIAVAQVLERSSDRRRAVIRGTTGAYWLRNQFELAKSYRGAGRAEDALAVEGELRKLLAFADADHPILLELQRLQSS